MGLVVLVACAGHEEQVVGEGRNAGECSDDADNDGDGLFDCGDPGCVGADVCAATDGGASDASTGRWTPQESGVPMVLRAITGNGSEVYAVGDFGVIVHSSDGGNFWARQSTPTTQPFYGVWCDPAACNNAWAVGAAGAIIRTLNAGLTWSAQPSGTTNQLNSVWGMSSTDIFVAGYSGTALHSTNAGTMWTASTTVLPMTVTFYAISGRSFGDTRLVGKNGNGGVIYKQSGTGFAAEVLPLTGASGDAYYAVAGTTTGQLVAAGTQGRISRYVTTWSQVTSGTTADIRSVWAKDNVMVAVGNEGTILRSLDGGATWKPQESGTTAALLGVWGNARDDVFAVGTDGTILHYTE